MNKVLLTILAFPGAGLVSFIVGVVYLVIREVIEPGYLEKYQANEQLMMQLGMAIIFGALLIFGALVFLIYRNSNQASK